ncbi:MAG: DUF86 domain-containing protein [Fimbriimonas sp.]
MQRKAELFLLDVLETARELQAAVGDRTFEEYLSDPGLKRIVERLFYIIGESVVQAAKLDPLVEPGITNYRQIVTFRNLLAHAYWRIDHRLVYGVFEGDLPLLISEVEALLGQPHD